jgi:hypothetical protein
MSAFDPRRKSSWQFCCGAQDSTRSINDVLRLFFLDLVEGPMRRRDFITFVGGAAAWPLAARAQPPEKIRHVGVLLAGGESDPNVRADQAKFSNALWGSGWTEGQNITVDYRWAAGDLHRIRYHTRGGDCPRRRGDRIGSHVAYCPSLHLMRCNDMSGVG